VLAREKAALAVAYTLNKPQFLSTLKYEEIPGTKYIRLLSNFAYYSAAIKSTITVPFGFVCDGESVFFKSSTEAGVIHDYLYRKGSKPETNRREADAVFCEVSRVDGCWWITCRAKWAAVRLFAHGCWHKHNVMDDVSAE